MRGAFLKRTVAGVLAASLWLGGCATVVCATVVCAARSAAVGDATATESAWPQVPLSSLLAAILPDGTTAPVSPEEAAWLDHDTTNTALAAIREALNVRHPTSVPLSLLEATPDESGMTLRVSAYDDGVRVWIPDGITVDGTPYTLTEVDGAYELHLPEEQLPALEAMKVAVSYRMTVELDTEACVLLGDVAHQAAQTALQEREDYERALAEYQPALERYNTYLAAQKQYVKDWQAYTAYTKAYAQYEKDLAAYEQYEADMESYRAQKALYDAYLVEYTRWQTEYDAYLAILNDPDAYDRKYEAYLQWQADMAKVKSQLTIVDSCFKADPDLHRLYGTLRGDTVATVVNRQDELVSAGCNAQDIALADASTKALIQWLNGYEPLKTETDKYNYYAANYGTLKEHVNQLFGALDRLYANKIVPEILQMQGKLARYHQFVAQLYVLSCALDDGKLLNQPKTWTIADKTAEQALVHKTFLLTDENGAAPLDGGYPASVEAVLPPSELKPPQQPAVVPCPKEPVAVARPTEPVEVVRPVLPTPVARPAVPVAPTHSTELTALMSSGAVAVSDGRGLANEAYTYTATIRREWAVPLPADDRVQLSFYNRDGSVLLHTASVAVGEEFSLPNNEFLQSNAPADTPQYTYLATGWSDEEGVPVGASVTALESKSYYATYEAVLRHYTVTWVVGESRTSVSVPYGEIPVYEGAGAGRIVWSPAVTAVIGDVEYRGTYRSHYTVTWTWGDGEDEQLVEDYAAGAVPSFPGQVIRDIAGRYWYTFAGWSPEVSELTADTVYQAEFDAVDLTPGLPASATVSVGIQNGAYAVSGSGWLDGGSYTIDLGTLADMAANEARPLALEADGLALQILPSGVKALSEAADARLAVTWQDNQFFIDTKGVTISANVTFACDSAQRATLTPDGGTSDLQFSDEGRVTFAVSSGTTYRLARGYAVEASSVVGGLALTDHTVAPAGQTVTVTWSALPGYRLAGVVVTDATGATYPVTLNGQGSAYTFVMPGCDVTVTPAFSLIPYTVSFYVNGELISSQTYYYGQEVVLPDTPQGEPGRPFLGWSPAVTPVRGDAVYEAVFYTPSDEEQESRQYGWTIGQLVAVFLTSWVTVSAVTLTLFFLLRKRKKTNAYKD